MRWLVITAVCSENYLKHTVGSMQNHFKFKADRTLTTLFSFSSLTNAVKR